jgi:inosine-uridine nucleoside N-ribohydrolase
MWRLTNNWKGETPILFDLLAVSAVHAPDIARFEPLHVVVETDGLTREIKDRPANAQVAVASDAAKVVDYMTDRLAR